MLGNSRFFEKPPMKPSKTSILFFSGIVWNSANISYILSSLKIHSLNIIFVNDLQESASGMVPSSSFSESEGWLFPVNTIYKQDGQYYLDLVAVNITPSGYSTLKPERLGSVYVKSSSIDTPRFLLIENYSKMMSKDKPVVNILPWKSEGGVKKLIGTWNCEFRSA